jgi:hypothetical protein
MSGHTKAGALEFNQNANPPKRLPAPLPPSRAAFSMASHLHHLPWVEALIVAVAAGVAARVGEEAG